MSAPSLALPNGHGLRWLLFGDEGSGKTHLLAGIQRLTSRYLYIDNEGSTTAFAMPRYTKDAPVGLLALSPERAGEVNQIVLDGIRAAASGVPLWDAVILDGLTEHQLVRSQAIAAQRHREDAKEDSKVLSQRGWGLLLNDLLVLAQHLIVLSDYGTFVGVTAGVEIENDPKSGGLEARPFCQGAFGRNVGRYFDVVTYVKGVVENRVPKHTYHMLKTGAYRTKNRWETEWQALKLPAEVTNPTLELLLGYIQQAAKHKLEEVSIG